MSHDFCLNENQVYYLKTVLGVESVLWPSTMSSVHDKEATKIDWRGPQEASLTALFPVSRAEFPPSAEAESLIEKMVRAMKLDLAKVRFAVWPMDLDFEKIKTELEQEGTEPVVLFGAKVFDLASGDVISLGGHRMFATHSLSELMSQTECKRKTWNHLQAVMKEL